MSLSTITRVDGPPTTVGAETIDDDGAMPTRVDRFFIFRQLGEGGMGRVYLGYDEELDRKLAIKVWRGKDDSEVRVRMLREAQALARLSHPNVVTVYEVGEESGQVYLAMEYVEGETLRRWVQESPRPIGLILDRYLQAGRGLAAAHAAGVLHRDFKPDNAIAGADGRVRVLDFGLARAERSLLAEESLSDRPVIRVASAGGVLDAPMTVAGTILGTPAYMPPEQLVGATADVRSDIFAFSVALWEALYGVRPYRAESIRELAEKILAGDPDDGERGRAVPRRLRAALLRGLAADPDERWQSMDEYLHALSRGARRLRWIPLVAVAVLALTILAGLFGAGRWQERREAAACEARAAAIDGVWNQRLADALERAAHASDVDFAPGALRRLLPILTGYADRWRAASVTACERELDDVWTEQRAAEAVTCLEDRLWSFEALILEVSRADLARIQQALPAAYGLSPIDRCLDPAWLRQRIPPPDDLRSRAEIDAIREAFARARALEAVGKVDEARSQANALVARADEVGWRPLQARARLLAGRLAEEQSVDEAARLLTEGFFLAQAAGEELLAADLATRLVVAVGVDQARPSEGHLWGRWAAMLIERQPAAGRSIRRAALDSQLGILAQSEGDIEAADAAWRAALALHETTVGPQHPDVAKLLNNIGTLRQAVGKRDEARELWERALAIWEASLGPDHPLTAAVRVNLGLIYFVDDDLARALRSTERALVIWERDLGPEHAKVATALINIGRIQEERGDMDAALAAFVRAIEITEATYGADSRALSGPLVGLATVQAKLGRDDEAIRTLERARALAIASDDADARARIDLDLGALLFDVSRERAAGLIEGALATLTAREGGSRDALFDALARLGEAHLARGRASAAILDLERALRLEPPPEGWDPELEGDARFALARALVADGRERARALDLADEAAELFHASKPVADDQLTALAAWRRALARPAPASGG
ncbi:MAG: serine/threonine-protein kinase [Nannocystaceae bacterium]